MEPITENSTYVKDNLNTSLGIMTKPDKRVICYLNFLLILNEAIAGVTLTPAIASF